MTAEFSQAVQCEFEDRMLLGNDRFLALYMPPYKKRYDQHLKLK